MKTCPTCKVTFKSSETACHYCGKQLESLFPSDAAACSSSSTPESNEAWDAVSRTPDGMHDSRVPISAYAYAMSDHSKKMERERDAAIAVLMVIEERYIDGCDTYEDWKFMGDTARAFLSENVDVELPPNG
jgi:hypothetical protein